MSIDTEAEKLQKACDAWERIADERTAEVVALKAEIARLAEVERRHDALYAHFADVHAALGKHDDKTLTAAGSVRKLVAEVESLGKAYCDEHCGTHCTCGFR